MSRKLNIDVEQWKTDWATLSPSEMAIKYGCSLRSVFGRNQIINREAKEVVCGYKSIQPTGTIKKWRPNGTIVRSFIKTEKGWVALQRHNWCLANGKEEVPKGYIVWFIDKDPQNYEPSNLTLRKVGETKEKRKQEKADKVRVPKEKKAIVKTRKQLRMAAIRSEPKKRELPIFKKVETPTEMRRIRIDSKTVIEIKKSDDPKVAIEKYLSLHKKRTA